MRLRPVEEGDLRILEDLTQDPEKAGKFARFGWFDPGRYRRRWAENGLIGEGGGTLMVMRGDEPLGFVAWRRRQTTPAAHCWSMGIALLPDARGHGYTHMERSSS
ncbi:GNAT family N-acetyltransferase [Actinoallomurus sp. NPDC052274]|uniref:GNAT family N-acetyltransferase n=1 Tax=Actinoallomurus sp. NPDC052274 TaxID=3155420 RepID=UPI00342EC8B4